MNLLDENIRDDQRVLLRKWRIPFRQVGKEILRSGIQDEELIPFLHGLRSATLFTQDKGFFKRELWHKRYSLVYVDVRYNELLNLSADSWAIHSLILNPDGWALWHVSAVAACNSGA